MFFFYFNSVNHFSIVRETKMSDKCVIVIAGYLEDHNFNHICYIAECLSTLLPNFHFKNISKSSTEWKSWLYETCARHEWSHMKSPLIWKEIGLTHTNINYIGGSTQFWELLHNYYNITSHLSKEDLEALQSDLLFAHNGKKLQTKCLDILEKRREVTIVGAGRSMCPDLVSQLIMTKELWLTHGVTINLYDEPGCFFKLKRILRDAQGVGGGLNTVKVLDNIPDGLHDCDILIYLDALSREEYEGLDSWLQRNYKCIEELSMLINKYAPLHMKVVFCSTGPTCFYVNIMHALVTKLPKTSIIAVSSHYGLELTYEFASSLGLTLQNFGCPPVWGYLGINQFVDLHHMIKKCAIYDPNKITLDSNKNIPFASQRSELRWCFYMAHDNYPYKNHFKRKSLLQYQVGRSEDFQKCRAICDLLKLWYSNKRDIGDEIISLGISSDGSFGIPKGLAFSQPVHLIKLEDQSRIWVPFRDFPMPNMPLSIFQNLIETGVIIKQKITELRKKKANVKQDLDSALVKDE